MKNPKTIDKRRFKDVLMGDVSITVDLAAFDENKRVEANETSSGCRKCAGSGVIHSKGQKRKAKCQSCKGSGVVTKKKAKTNSKKNAAKKPRYAKDDVLTEYIIPYSRGGIGIVDGTIWIAPPDPPPMEIPAWSVSSRAMESMPKREADRLREYASKLAQIQLQQAVPGMKRMADKLEKEKVKPPVLSSAEPKRKIRFNDD